MTSQPGRIIVGSDLRKDVEERPDVCVVGSGAGGTVLAAQLAAKGASVVVLEEGGRYTRDDFDMEEATAYSQLYQEKGQRATSDLAISILQGRALGGSTVINWTANSRAPERVLAHWARAHGIEGLDGAVLAPHFAAVEERLGITEWPLERANENNRLLWKGAGALNFSRELLRRNVRGCETLGYCGMGCPIDARQSMSLTYGPDAIASGARFYVKAKVVKLERQDRRISAVHAEVCDPITNRPSGRRIVVFPKVTVLSAGAINGPELLLRSGIDSNRQTGRRTFFHPMAASVGIFSQRIEGWRGAPQSVACRQFAERGTGKMGFFIGTAPVHPMLVATSLGGFGDQHAAVMARLAHASVLVAYLVDGFLPDEVGGTVALRADGRVLIDYPFHPAHWEALREACKVMARLQLAAGATEVYSLHEEPVVMRQEAEIAQLDGAPWIPARLALFTTHQMGGCAMGRDPEKSVVDPTLKHHQLDNLYVVDGSVFPTSLGVNPQETICALAHWAAERIAKAML